MLKKPQLAQWNAPGSQIVAKGLASFQGCEQLSLLFALRMI